MCHCLPYSAFSTPRRIAVHAAAMPVTLSLRPSGSLHSKPPSEPLHGRPACLGRIVVVAGVPMIIDAIAREVSQTSLPAIDQPGNLRRNETFGFAA